MSAGKKVRIIKEAAKLDSKFAILPILPGITSYHSSVRVNAEKTLKKIQSEIAVLLADSSEKKKYQKGMEISASVCASIYTHIHPIMKRKELNIFFQALIEFKGKGAYFAFKAFSRGLVHVESAEKIIFSVSEPFRLAFVDQYLQTHPAERLTYGILFKRILESIEQRKPVVDFYAGLFDKQRDADPFLNNIHPDLRNPHEIITHEIRSQPLERQIMGLKALAMIVTRISTDLLIDILTTNAEKLIRIVIYNIIEHSPVGTYPKLFHPILNLLNTRDKQEALHAFKALVVCGKLPLYTVLKMVREEYPALIPAIRTEISFLSKISFFFIQDIALHKEKYANSNSDVNLACVLGMIKKRPERVIKVFEKHNLSPGSGTKNVRFFLDKVRKLLKQEKKSIETEFDSIIRLIKKKSSGSNELTQDRLEAIKRKKQSARTDFSGGIYVYLLGA